MKKEKESYSLKAKRNFSKKQWKSFSLKNLN